MRDPQTSPAPTPTPARWTPRQARLALALFSLVLVLGMAAIAELTLRLLGFPVLPASGWTSCQTPSECNELGFRGQPLRYDGRDRVVVLLGDSAVTAWAHPFASMPERRLEHALVEAGVRAKVFSLGVDGFGQDQELLVLERYLASHRADAVVLWYTVGNDLTDTLYPVTPSNTPKPTFWLENGQLRGPTEGWLEPVGPGLKLLALLRPYRPETRLGAWIRRLPPAYRPMERYAGPVSDDWQRDWDRGMRFRFFDLANERTSHVMSLTPRSPRTRYGLDLTRALLGRMKARVEAQGGAFMLLKEDRHGERRMTMDPIVHALNSKYYVTSQRQVEENLAYLFLGYSALRIPLDLEDDTVSTVDLHLNAAAIDELMTKGASALKPRLPGRPLD